MLDMQCECAKPIVVSDRWEAIDDFETAEFDADEKDYEAPTEERDADTNATYDLQPSLEGVLFEGLWGTVLCSLLMGWHLGFTQSLRICMPSREDTHKYAWHLLMLPIR
eukprot:TRINITY_DN5348_c0_g1_i1.p1 TRINITY_DN5348_c0_g1~~TRINITY_DN5348_c0_g1_i1.p1  ORF type:complete len:109 (+),score=27.98 TRINITY_DN5348_c0_g1_i1:91-417(+)